MQSVIENIVNSDAEYLRSVILSLASNSRLRSGEISDPQAGNDSLEILTASGYISSVNSNNTFTVSFSAPQAADIDINKSDMVKITGFSDAEYDGKYYIESNIESEHHFLQL